MVKRIAADSIVVTALNAGAQLAGFVLFAAITGIFGANERTDAFFLAYTVPMLFIGPVGSAIRSALVPILAECRARNPALLGSLIGAALVQGLLVSTAACLLLALGTPVVLPVAAGGLGPDARHLAALLTLYLLPLIVGQTISAVLSAAYNVAGHFTLPALAAGSRHLVAFVLILLLHRPLGILVLPLGFVAAMVYQVAMLAAFWRKLDVRLRWSLRLTIELRKALRVAVPLVLGSAGLYLTVLVTRLVAAHLEPGSVTILDYAARITSALMEILTTGVLLVVLASWSHSIQQDRADEVRLRLRRTVLLVLFLVMPVLTILFALRVPTVTLLLGRGQFNAELVKATAGVMGVLIVAAPTDVVSRIYMRYFIARQSTWTITAAAVTRVLVVAPLALALFGPFVLRGLALADGLGVAASAIFMIVLADARQGRTLAGALLPLGRITFLAVGAGLVAAMIGHLLQGANVVLLVVAASSAGGIAYLLGAWLWRADELRALAGMFGRPLAGAR